MNINAGTNQYNLSLKKMKEEKRPSFATIFDKLDARSKKLNAKNPLNAVLTNDQMYRYYLSEVEPQLHGSTNDFDLEDVIGDKSLKDMKLSEFAKLLSGDLDNTKTTPVYETLTAGVSYSPMVAPLIAPPTPIPTPVPTPTPTPPPTIATPVIPAPSSSVASALAPPVPVSGLMPTGTGSIPVAAPVAPVSAPAPAPVAPAPALTISTAPAAAGIATPPFSPSSVFASLSSGVSSAMGAVSSLVSSKPSPSAISVPPSAVASGAATAVASTVPTAAGTPTPATGVGTPAIAGATAAGAAAAGAAAGAPPPTAAEIAAVAMTTAQNAGYKKREDIDAYIDGLNEGLDPPERPSTLKGAIDIENEDWIKYTISLITYNKMASTPFKLTDKQLKIAENYERALKTAADKNDLESIVQNTIIIAQTPKPAGGAKSGKGKKKK
jgi:hypothetical protein